MANKIIQRILQQVEIPQLLEVLSEQLNPSDLQSLLLEVYQLRAKKISPAFLQKQHLENRFTKPSLLSPLVQMEFDRLAFEEAKDVFEPINLAPLAPLGVCSSIGKVDQKKIVSSNRNVEVTSDPTNVMALESAIRRNSLLKKNPKNNISVNLCCSHRVTRAQAFGGKNQFAHFQMFALTSAGKDIGNFGFEVKSLKEHLRFYVQLMTDERTFQFNEIEVLVSPIEKKMQPIIEKVLSDFSDKFLKVKFSIDQERTNGIGYYQTLCFTIKATSLKGEKMLLVDGGITNWTQQLMSNKKERLMISAIGSERVGLEFFQKS